MEAALKAAQDGIGVNKAAELHGIPKSTLKDRVSGRVAHGSKSGPKSYLTSQEETQLADYLLDVSEAGYGKTRKAMVEGIAKEKGVMKSDNKVSVAALSGKAATAFFKKRRLNRCGMY